MRVDNQRCRRSRSTHMATVVRSMLAIRAEMYLSSGKMKEPQPEMMPKSPWAASSSRSSASFTTATFVCSHRPRVERMDVVWRPATATREAMLAISSPFSFHQHVYGYTQQQTPQPHRLNRTLRCHSTTTQTKEGNRRYQTSPAVSTCTANNRLVQRLQSSICRCCVPSHGPVQIAIIRVSGCRADVFP